VENKYPRGKTTGIFIFHDFRSASDFDPLAIRAIHQKDKRFIVLGEVAGGDTLSIAYEVSKGQCVVIEYFHAWRGGIRK